MTRTCLLQSLLLGLPRSPGRSPLLQLLLLSTKHYGKKLLTKEPNNSKELQIKAYTKQLGSTGKERRNRASKKEYDRGIRDRPNDPRQQMDIPRIGGGLAKTATGEDLRTTGSRTGSGRIF